MSTVPSLFLLAMGERDSLRSRVSHCRSGWDYEISAYPLVTVVTQAVFVVFAIGQIGRRLLYKCVSRRPCSRSIAFEVVRGDG
jgi:hypothetical protein